MTILDCGHDSDNSEFWCSLCAKTMVDLAVSRERQACAKVARDEGADLTGAAKETASAIADAIRARGQQ